MFILSLLHIWIDPHRLFAVIAVVFHIGIVDSVNGATNSKLRIASARELKQADKGADVKKLSAATMIDVESWIYKPKSARDGYINQTGERVINKREEGQFSKC